VKTRTSETVSSGTQQKHLVNDSSELLNGMNHVNKCTGNKARESITMATTVVQVTGVVLSVVSLTVGRAEDLIT
jgi:hypothetical protein